TMLVRQGAGAHVAGGPASLSPRPLASFTAMAADVAQRPVRRRSAAGMAVPFADAVPPAADGPTLAGYTLLGAMRWNQPDAGQTVWWYRNTLRPTPQAAATTDTQLQTAATAWTAPGEATLTLAF